MGNKKFKKEKNKQSYSYKEKAVNLWLRFSTEDIFKNAIFKAIDDLRNEGKLGFVIENPTPGEDEKEVLKKVFLNSLTNKGYQSIIDYLKDENRKIEQEKETKPKEKWIYEKACEFFSDLSKPAKMWVAFYLEKEYNDAIFKAADEFYPIMGIDTIKVGGKPYYLVDDEEEGDQPIIPGIAEPRTEEEVIAKKKYMKHIFMDFLSVNNFKYINDYINSKYDPGKLAWIETKARRFFSDYVVAPGIYTNEKITGEDRILRDKILLKGLVHRVNKICDIFFSKNCPRVWETFTFWARKYYDLGENVFLTDEYISEKIAYYRGTLFLDIARYEDVDYEKVEAGRKARKQVKREPLEYNEKAGFRSLINFKGNEDFFNYFAFILFKTNEYDPEGRNKNIIEVESQDDDNDNGVTGKTVEDGNISDATSSKKTKVKLVSLETIIKVQAAPEDDKELEDLGAQEHEENERLQKQVEELRKVLEEKAKVAKTEERAKMALLVFFKEFYDKELAGAFDEKVFEKMTTSKNRVKKLTTKDLAKKLGKDPNDEKDLASVRALKSRAKEMTKEEFSKIKNNKKI